MIVHRSVNIHRRSLELKKISPPGKAKWVAAEQVLLEAEAGNMLVICTFKLIAGTGEPASGWHSIEHDGFSNFLLE
jgi:hypothetical protein